MVKKKIYAVFYGEFENEKKKKTKEIFSNIPAHDLNFHGK
jgi:hypothetical protein